MDALTLEWGWVILYTYTFTYNTSLRLHQLILVLLFMRVWSGLAISPTELPFWIWISSLLYYYGCIIGQEDTREKEQPRGYILYI